MHSREIYHMQQGSDALLEVNAWRMSPFVEVRLPVVLLLELELHVLLREDMLKIPG